MRRLLIISFAAIFVFCACDTTIKVPTPEGGGRHYGKEEFVISVDTLFIKEGERTTIGWKSPTSSTPLVLEWKSSNEDVITIDNTGCVTALNYGFALIKSRAKFPEFNMPLECTIPVHVSLDDSVVENPEELYQKWLGRWSITGVAATVVDYSPMGINTKQYSSYTISITELEPMESFRLTGWEKLNHSRYSTDYPGKPLLLTARFDKKSGMLVFIHNKTANEDTMLGFYQSPYSNGNLNSSSGRYSKYEGKETIIGYARLYSEIEAVIRGAYYWAGGNWHYHLGMGFADAAGETVDEPIFFPIIMLRSN